MIWVKTILKTFVLCVVIIGALFISYRIYDKKNSDSDKTAVLDISPSDPVVQLVMGKIYSSNIFRGAGFSVENFTNDDIIHYGMDNLTKDNYSIKTIAHKKSLCEVTGKILFTSTSNCNIKIINNDYFTKLIKNDFNIDVEVKFDTFTYKGHYCKNDGKRYYCLLSKYTETKKNLSFIHEAYEEGDTLVVKEYYLNVDLNNKDLCNLYLNPEYCEKKNVNEPIVVPDEIIINNGVLYQHVFKKIDDKYYYLQSFILSER